MASVPYARFMEESGVGERCRLCGALTGHVNWCPESPTNKQTAEKMRAAVKEATPVWQKPSMAGGYDMRASDPVHPDHYTKRAIEPWDYVAANGLGYFEGNAIKYVTRWRDKNGITDLRKAIRFLEKLIEVEEKLVRDAGQDVGGQPATQDAKDRGDAGYRTE